MEGLEEVLRSDIDGEFEGFEDEVLFKLIDGTYWVQDEYKYWYHYAFCPEALILRDGDRLYIQVDGQSETVPVRQITDVIESKIDGEFNGWEGETTYTLVNGQVWQQSSDKYEHKYSNTPKVLIYNPGGGYIMRVAGTTENVRRSK